MYQDTKAQVKYRKDYRPSDYLIARTRLKFALFDDYVRVNSQLSICLNPDHPSSKAQAATKPNLPPLILDGVDLELLKIQVDDRQLQPKDYKVEPHRLILKPLRKEFILSIEVKIYPHKNTSLNGLYLSQAKFCTQCEAEGFRKITYYLDRPDIMAEFFVTVEADKEQYPLLLSNGNQTDSEQKNTGRHSVSWHDPYPKPSYLFALVAGDLDCLEDRFTTAGGRQVKLQLFVDKGKLDQCQFAMDSLIKAMRWDENKFSLEYDLDIYMIVAVGDFNMGAMENKGLNIFNTAYVLAHKKTATDSDFAGVERVIAHEYFHNWTGNRVTCRDWFQLSLKEGLTVFRDQLFSEDMQSQAVERIQQVKTIRAAQFTEDASPLAHPIRPDSYIEMNNFYTVTVYNKGAEIIRMMHSLLGEKGFRKGMDLYFKRHTGQAVTCEDFILAMEDANQVEWQTFRHWYEQSGTPEVTIKQEITDKGVNLHLSQSCPATPMQKNKPAFMIPVRLGFMAQSGVPLKFRKAGSETWQTEMLLSLNHEQETWQFELALTATSNNSPPVVIPSLMRQFSAPVKRYFDYSVAELAALFSHDTDSFNRWDAGQSLMRMALNSNSTEALHQLNSIIIQSCRQLLDDDQLDPALKALALQVPDLNELINDCADIDRLFSNHRNLKFEIANQLKESWLLIYQTLSSKKRTNAAERQLQNMALDYLCIADHSLLELALKQQQTANNMTNEIAALQVICRSKHSNKEKALQRFFSRWQQQDLVIDKWFNAQVNYNHEDVFLIIENLLEHPSFSINNPNRVRALIGNFVANNHQQFHSLTGKGYQLLTDTIIRLNIINPQIGARFAKQFGNWKKLDARRQALISDHLEAIIALPELTPDILEVVTKSLGE